MRLYRLVWQEKDNPLNDETIEDTFLDILVYSAIAVLLIRNKWPPSLFSK
jgi:hypothetical protein